MKRGRCVLRTGQESDHPEVSLQHRQGHWVGDVGVPRAWVKRFISWAGGFVLAEVTLWHVLGGPGPTPDVRAGEVQ